MTDADMRFVHAALDEAYQALDTLRQISQHEVLDACYPAYNSVTNALKVMYVYGYGQIDAPKPKEDTLLPCPFCRGEAYLGATNDGSFVNCADCLASTNVLIPDKSNDAEAILAWNSRA